MNMAKKAFTLIELLVVVAIIALLLSIIVPALRKVKQQATGAVCLSNIRQLAVAWHTFATDNDGVIVNGHVPRDETQLGYNASNPYWIWFPQDAAGGSAGESAEVTLEYELNGIRKGLLFPYINAVDVYHCPGDKSKTMFANATNADTKPWWNSYSITGGMNGEEQYRSVPTMAVAKKFSDITNPGGKVVFLENVDDRGWLMGSWLMDHLNSRWVDPIAIWHKDRGTLGFADGHAEMHNWVDKSTVENAKLGRVGFQPDTATESCEDSRFMKQAYVPGRR